MIRTADLDDFTRGYLNTALFSSTDLETGEPLDRKYEIEDFSQDFLKQAVEDCRDFQYANDHYLIAEWLKFDRGNVMWIAGCDFWLTRNRHGAGFWDGEWADKAGKALTEAAHVYGAVDITVGRDGKLC